MHNKYNLRNKDLFEFWEFMAVKTARDNPQIKPVVLNLSKFAMDYCSGLGDHQLDFPYWFGDDITEIAKISAPDKSEKLSLKSAQSSQELEELKQRTNMSHLSKALSPSFYQLAYYNFKNSILRLFGQKTTTITEQVKHKSAIIFLKSLQHFSRRLAEDLDKSGFTDMMEDVIAAYDAEDAPMPDDIKNLMQDLYIFRHGRDVWPQAFPQHWRTYVPEAKAMIKALQDDELEINEAITYGCNLFYAGTQFMYATELLPTIDENLDLIKQVRSINKDMLRPN